MSTVSLSHPTDRGALSPSLQGYSNDSFSRQLKRLQRNGARKAAVTVQCEFVRAVVMC